MRCDVQVQLTSQMAAPHVSTLFLQLNVDDIGVCVPLNHPHMVPTRTHEPLLLPAPHTCALTYLHCTNALI